MGVGIDRSWQDDEARGVDGLVGGDVELRFQQTSDPPPFDDDSGIDDAARNDHLSAMDDCPSHSLLLSLLSRYRCCSTGESASCSPSPRRLNAITARKMASPGNVAIHH